MHGKPHQLAFGEAFLLVNITSGDTPEKGKAAIPFRDGGLPVLAEREGFEPSNQVTPITGLANQRLRPLGHLSRNLPMMSVTLAEEEGFEPSEGLPPQRFSRPPP